MHLSPILVTSAIFSPLVLSLPIPSPRPDTADPCDDPAMMGPMKVVGLGVGLGLNLANSAGALANSGGSSKNGANTNAKANANGNTNTNTNALSGLTGSM